MMTIPLHPIPLTSTTIPQATNPLPQILHTPAGYALLELQGNFNLPSTSSSQPYTQISIGHLTFPDYDASHPENTAWMKRVLMYVGKHQRLFGEVKKLPKAVAIVRRRETKVVQGDPGMNIDEEGEELEIVEIVKYKILFSTRPEPVGTWVAGA